MQIYFLFFTFKLVFSFSQRFLDINRDSFNDYIESNRYNNNKRLFLIFYKDNCTFCEEALALIEKEIIPEYKGNNNLIDFGKINCDLEQNIWLNIQFKIKRIPYIILIIGNYFYELKYKPDKYNIKDFLDNIIIKNDFSNKKRIPEQIGTFEKIIIVINFIIKTLRNIIYKIFRIRLHKYIIICILLLILFLFFWLIKIFFCFFLNKLRRICKKKEKINLQKQENEESSQIIKEEELNKYSPNVSESEINDENNKNNNISDDIFNQIGDENIKNKYKKD